MPVPPGPLPLLRCRGRDVLLTSDGDDVSSSQPDSYCCRFCPRPGEQHVLASADEDGAIKLWDTRPAAEHVLMRRESAHTNAIYELDWSSDGRHLLSAAGDRAIKLWDAERLTLLAEFRRHSRTVKTVTFLPEDPCVFASGGRDGVVEVWDLRVAKQISHEIRPRRPHTEGKHCTTRKGDTPDTITSLVFRDDKYLLSATSGDSGVSVWDLRKNYSAARRQPAPLCRLEGAGPGRGVVCMTADRWRAQLYVSRINDVIQRYSMTNWTADPDGSFSGHQCGSFYVRCCVSPDGSRLACGSSDHTALLWSTASPGPPAARLAGHTDEVTCVAWSSDARTLATVSDDLRLRLWRADICTADPAADTAAGHDGALRMERLPRPAAASASVPPTPPLPLPLYTLCRETGSRWRPGRTRGSDTASPPPPAAPAPAPAQSRPRPSRRSAAATAAGSSAFLTGWLRGNGRGAAAAPTRSSPRKRPSGGSDDTAAVSPSKRPPLSLTLSPSKMSFAPVSPSKRRVVTPTLSPSKRRATSPAVSPSEASASAACCANGTTTPTGTPSKRRHMTQAVSPSKRGTTTPTKSPSRRRDTTPPGSPSRASSSAAHSPRLQLPSAAGRSRLDTPTRTSPRKAAATPPCAGQWTPAGCLRLPASPAHSPHTPTRSSPRKSSAKALFSVSPAVRGVCVTPESRRLRPADQYRSPTADLPNWVVDGVSPHRPAVARPRPSPRADWLTRLSQRKRAQASPAAAPPAAKRSRRAAGTRRQTPE